MLCTPCGSTAHYNHDYTFAVIIILWDQTSVPHSDGQKVQKTQSDPTTFIFVKNRGPDIYFPGVA